MSGMMSRDKGGPGKHMDFKDIRVTKNIDANGNTNVHLITRFVPINQTEKKKRKRQKKRKKPLPLIKGI